MPQAAVDVATEELQQPPQPSKSSMPRGGRNPPSDFQLNEDYDNNFYVFVGLLHRLRAKYEYVKRGYERKKLPPGRSLKHLVSIIESFIDLASNSIAAPPQYEGRVQPGDVPVPEGARSDHVLRRRMVVIEDAGQLFALDPAVVIGGEICMCGKSRRQVKPLPHYQDQQQQQQQQQPCEHCVFEKANLLRIARELSRVASRGLREQKQQQQQQQEKQHQQPPEEQELQSQPEPEAQNQHHHHYFHHNKEFPSSVKK